MKQSIARHIIASHTCFSRRNTPYLLEKHSVSLGETLRSSVYLSCKQILLTLLSHITVGLSPCAILRSLRYAACLILMMVVGIGEIWGQLPTITTDTNGNGTIEDSEKVLYLIQTNQFQSFYMIPNGDNVSTANIPNAQMLWYFLDAGEVSGTQYYYIINNSTGKCIYNHNGNSRGIQLTVLNNLSDANKEKCKFKLVEDNSNGTVGFYNIDVKASQTYFGLNKQGGSVNKDNPIRLTNNDYIHDLNSKWKFIPYNGTFIWPDPPFTPSTTNQKYYFKIQNKTNGSYYVSSDASSPKNVTISSTESDNMVWYFKEAITDSWIKYYYIVNPEAGEYMYYKGTATNGSEQNDAIILKEKTSENEDRFQFIIVQTARIVKINNVETPVECYTIIPKLLKDQYWKANSISPTSISDGNILGIRNGRGSDTNNSHWTFDPVWGDPVVTCDENGTITITGEDGATFYYTKNGETPTETESETNFKYTETPNKPTISEGITTIKVRAIGGEKSPSRVITQKIVYVPNRTFASSTYDGTAQTPVVKVGETTIDPEEYNVSYKLGETDVTECKDVGTYTVTITDIDGGEYIVYGSGSFTINPKALTITAGSDTKVYDGTALTKDSYTNTELGTGDAIESVTVTGSQMVVGSSANVPSAAVIKKGETNVTANYNITYANGTLEVSQRALTITADSDSKEYDGVALTKNSYTITNNTSLATGDAITSITVNGSQTDRGESDNAPSAAVIKNNNGNGEDVTACYNITYVNGTLSVTGRVITITADSDTKVYDGTALTKNSYTYDTAKLYEGDAFESVTITGTQTVVGSSDNVPSAAVIKHGETDVTANYDFNYVNGTLTVTPKDLTITAKPKTITYGDAPANDGVTYTGFVNSETEAVLAGTLDYDYSYTQYGNVGNTYTITPKGLTSSNYNITFTAGTLTVNQKEVGLTWQNTSLPYNGSAQAPTATATGLVNGDEISVTVTGAQTNVGTGYTATASELTGEKAANYKLPAANTTTFEITAKELTITADSDEKVYDGTALTKETYTNTALVEGHSLTGVTVTGSQTNAGSSNNVPSGGTITDANSVNVTSNYHITYANGTLTVNRKAVTITANDASKTYNSTALTEGGFIASALETGDSHTFTVAMTAESTITNAGTQPNVIATVDDVAVTAGNATEVGNYLVTTANGTLTINRKTVTITANSDEKTYNGAPLTANGFTATALEDGDNHSFTVVMTAESTITNAGTQPNVIATVDGVAVTTGVETEVGNYLVTTVDGTLTINGATVTITINLNDWVYGSPRNPSVSGNTGNGAVTYSYKKQTEDDSKYKVDNKPVNVGEYTIKAEVAATATTAAATAIKNFSITKAPITIKAEAKQKDYLDDDPQLTYTVTGLKNNDTEANVLTCVLQRVAGEAVGEYAITKRTNDDKIIKSNNNNYSFSSFTGATFTINPKNLGNGELPDPGISIYAHQNTENSWSVKLYNGKSEFSADNYESGVVKNSDNNYTVTVTAKGNNCTGSATATYIVYNYPTAISSEEKAGPYYVSDRDLRTSSDITPYVVNKVNPLLGTISITPIDYIPKDVPVLLLTNNEATGLTFSSKNDDKTESDYILNSNKLKYSSSIVTVQKAEVYMYYLGEFVLTLAGDMPENRFYLYNPNYTNENADPGNQNEAPSRTLNIIKDETTGLIKLVCDEITESVTDRWYSLDGRRLSGKPAKKGIYIKNGKKTVVK